MQLLQKPVTVSPQATGLWESARLSIAEHYYGRYQLRLARSCALIPEETDDTHVLSKCPQGPMRFNIEPK
jgi:hypothetical protein